MDVYKKSSTLIEDLFDDMKDDELLYEYSKYENRIGLTVDDVNLLFGDFILKEDYYENAKFD